MSAPAPVGPTIDDLITCGAIPARRPVQSYRQRLALAVGSLRSRLIFATPERLAADAWRSRMVRAAVYEDNHGAGGTPYRTRLQSFLPCVHG